jgi:hypothetical protein
VDGRLAHWGTAWAVQPVLFPSQERFPVCYVPEGRDGGGGEDDLALGGRSRLDGDLLDAFEGKKALDPLERDGDVGVGEESGGDRVAKGLASDSVIVTFCDLAVRENQSGECALRQIGRQD